MIGTIALQHNSCSLAMQYLPLMISGIAIDLQQGPTGVNISYSTHPCQQVHQVCWIAEVRVAIYNHLSWEVPARILLCLSNYVVLPVWACMHAYGHSCCIATSTATLWATAQVCSWKTNKCTYYVAYSLHSGMKIAQGFEQKRYMCTVDIIQVKCCCIQVHSTADISYNTIVQVQEYVTSCEKRDH
jgi:hypothetical protein